LAVNDDVNCCICSDSTSILSNWLVNLPVNVSSKLDKFEEAKWSTQDHCELLLLLFFERRDGKWRSVLSGDRLRLVDDEMSLSPLRDDESHWLLPLKWLVFLE
jgi:hypothetical protein